MHDLLASQASQPFRIVSVLKEDADGVCVIRAEFGVPENTYSFILKTADIDLNPCGDAWLCISLQASMKLGVDIQLDASVSPRLRASAEILQDIFCKWYPAYRRSSLKLASEKLPVASHGQGVGLFFTGGMDSFYTLLKHRDEITHIIFVHGIDVGLRDVRLRQQVSEMLAKVGREFDVKVVEIESNARGFVEHFGLAWTECYASVFASIGHLMASTLGRIYQPSNFTYAELFPWGSHVLTDPLWSSEGIEFVHDGCEASRIEKAMLLAKSDIAMNSLRVCFNNVDSAYNCGSCEKCVRTMINLQAAGALGRCRTFPDRIDLKLVQRLDATSIATRAFLVENMHYLAKQPENKALYEALLRLYRRPIWLSRLYLQFWRRIRVWRRSIRRRLGLEARRQIPALGGNELDQ